MFAGRRPRMLRSIEPASTHPGKADEVLIVGGGVAALETLLALHTLAAYRVHVTLLAPNSEFVYRPLKVAEPFARGHSECYDVRAMLREHDARFVRDSFARLDADRRTVVTESGTEITYDSLVLAVGARPRRFLERALTFGVERDPEMFNGLLADIEQGYSKHVAFVVPSGTTWPLPLYELALMTAWQARGMSIEDLRIEFYTPEDWPLAIFGPKASDSVARLLATAGIDVHTGVHLREVGKEVVVEPDGQVLGAQRVVALPTQSGPGLAGVPSDADGFILTEPDGSVRGLSGVFAAGDGTNFPVKQGGLATQQADAIAEVVAASAGVDIEPTPFRPVLRGMLLTGDRTQYMRFSLAGGDGEGSVAGHCLWWPPTKIAGRYLAPYLTGRDTEDLLPKDAAEHEPMRVQIRFAQDSDSSGQPTHALIHEDAPEGIEYTHP